MASWKPETEVECFNVILNRNPSYGFGILIRRGLSTQRKTLQKNGQFLESRSHVLYAEPGPCGIRCGLLPGDRLLAVNGQSVEGFVRNEVIQLIRSSGTQITVQVQPSPELVEFSLRYLVPFTAVSPAPEAYRVCVRQHLVEIGSLRHLSEELCKASAVVMLLP
ncbi:unnamed protein product [Echinostoma caproni]|uniref:PDZ domain-containing protein n=1 Tax=Echinostoma caproni TaxID=27848 RepID=A0A183ACM4_9TREM|nr:unnamed protein product [Echinostoma caproni]